MKIQLAFAWLNREDWPRWQEIDPSIPAYDQWEADIEERSRRSRVNGVSIELIHIKPGQFTAWCRAKGRAPDEMSRVDYAAALLARRPKE